MEGDDLPWGLFSPFQPHLLGELASTQENHSANDKLVRRRSRDRFSFSSFPFFFFFFFFFFSFSGEDRPRLSGLRTGVECSYQNKFHRRWPEHSLIL